MSASDSDRRTSGAPASWLKSNLAALGSAAVLTVYSAGFMRTRAAAERFSDAPVVRRGGAAHALAAHPGEAAPAAASGPTAAPATVASSPHTAAADTAHAPIVDANTTAAAQRVASAASTQAATPAPAAAAAPTPAQAAATAPTRQPTTAAAPTPAAQPAPAPTRAPAPTATVASAPTTAPAPVAQPTTPAPAPTSAPAPAPTAAPAPAASSSKAGTSADNANAPYKDGTYTGWGTSRHGDIQVTLVVQDGWIISATISQCLTQYSCSWIDQLPPEVTARQSADIDYVSGATQSSNAFYYAVQQAISKAK